MFLFRISKRSTNDSQNVIKIFILTLIKQVNSTFFCFASNNFNLYFTKMLQQDFTSTQIFFPSSKIFCVALTTLFCKSNNRPLPIIITSWVIICISIFIFIFVLQSITSTSFSDISAAQVRICQSSCQPKHFSKLFSFMSSLNFFLNNVFA